jgi:hypothetical protein
MVSEDIYSACQDGIARVADDAEATPGTAAGNYAVVLVLAAD